MTSSKGQKILVLGGIRSGKSELAERLAAESAEVTYVATALAGDEEMARRIEEHRRRRPGHWQTIECPWDLAKAVARSRESDCLLVDCVGFWVTNLMLGIPNQEALGEAQIAERVSLFAAAVRAAAGRVIIVSSEVGWGGVPANPLARSFADTLGQANQSLAQVADEVYLCAAGLNLRLK